MSRRDLLGAVGAAGAASALAGCTAGDDPAASVPAGAADSAARVPFAGRHQQGITLTPAPARSLTAAFRVVSPDRTALRAMFVALTDETRRLMAGTPAPERSPDHPPADAGVLGAAPPPDNLAIVVSVGASLFDERFGLAGRKPVELVRMPFLANDRLDPDRSHGDLLVTVEAEHQDTVVLALRQLMRVTRGDLVLAWLVDGYTRGTSPAGPGAPAPRNLLGFRDGTANLDPTDERTLERYVWLGESDVAERGEPAWAVGGSYHVVRQIRMFVEFWDRVRLSEQEELIGRAKESGAPLDGRREADEPDFAADPDGEFTPLDAHIRLANPRTPESADQLLYRRGFSYSRGFDRAGLLDNGLAFVSFQRSLSRQFLPIAERLDGEPLEEYLLPEGGGYFFALPGVPGDGHLGDGLLAD